MNLIKAIKKILLYLFLFILFIIPIILKSKSTKIDSTYKEWNYIIEDQIHTNIFIQNFNPLNIAHKIAQRIINETSFELVDVEQKAVLDLQVIDFQKAFNNRNQKSAFAFSIIYVDENQEISYGISFSSPLKIWINDELIFENEKETIFYFKEVAYSEFTFQDTFSVKLNKGINRIAIKSSLDGYPIVYLREIINAEQKPKSKFLPINSKITNYTWPWCFYIADNSLGEKFFVDSVFSLLTADNLSCRFIKPSVIKQLKINPNSTFKKDSFADWNYPNGILMLAMLNLSETTKDKQYKEFVEKYCNFILYNIQLFKKQYFINHDIRGSYHRIFRKCMLDDTGAPILPFVEIKLENHSKDYDALINEMTNYVLNKQTRLPDGTFCRPEPERWTVWADDLFMSVPLLVRAGILYNDKKYFDDAAKQIINFNKYLFDSETGLYKHGWFSRTNEKSKVFWGRANGWVVWATSEALLILPKGHPSYKKIEQIFQQHLEGIVNYQGQSGMWHQVLDDKNSFEETSCTAMFIIGLSRGIVNGWIDRKYNQIVFNAWNALKTKIDSSGVVRDISCGTGIGTTVEFYKTRERFDNDPRGLGAIITAAIEVDKLARFLTETK